MNPYEPPGDLERASYWKRFRHALNRGLREYKAGLVREKISSGEHLRTWLSAILACSLILFIAACVAVNVLQRYGILR